jgi:signal transduction histidine kinase/CheY-like chemotaxis protein
MQNTSRLLAALNWNVFQSRDAKAYRPINSPLIFFLAVLAAMSLVLYLAGNPANEFQLRISSLLIFGAVALIFALSRLSETLGRWMFAPILSLMIIMLASMWQNATFLIALLVPVVLSVVLVNLPALICTSLMNTVVLIWVDARMPTLMLNSDIQIMLLMSLWLVVLVLGGGYVFIEQFIYHANEDQARFQTLLEESRDQQLKLGQTMDDLMHSNRQLSLLYDKNITLRKAAEEAREAKTTYIARVSHEIRTPLTMILGITDCIIEDEATEEDLPLELLDDIHVIRRNSEHLLSLVNDVLDLTRAEAGQLILKKEWVDINTEIAKAVEIVQPLVNKKKLRLCTELDDGSASHPHLPPVYCDRTRIRQVILNLLSNAVRYTDAGQVGIHTESDGQWLTVKVWDTGPGVRPEDVERIFDPFYRGSIGVRQDTIGAGLGLSVSRQLVELHTGKIWLESQPGAGSAFYFTLPMTIGDVPVRSPIGFISENWIWTERKRPGLSLQTDRKRVMVCGSDDMFSSGFSDTNDIEFIQTLSIPEMIEAVDNTPAHLILINSSSLEDLLVKLEKASAHIKDTPIIGSVFTPLRQYVLQAGAVEFIQKPFSASKLLAAVTSAAPEPHKVLVVDDNLEVQHLITRMLSAPLNSTEFIRAANGAEALQSIHDHHPDLILMDLLLPDTDGWHLLEQIRHDPELTGIPVILVSAHDPVDELPKSQLMVFARGDGIPFDEFIHYALGNLS